MHFRAVLSCYGAWFHGIVRSVFTWKIGRKSVALFQAGNQQTAKRKRVGRPRKLARTITEVIGSEALEALLLKAYADAERSDGPSRAWFLSQMPKIDCSTKLPKGLPPLTSLKGCVAAMDAIGEMSRLGKITVADAEKSLALVNALAHARVSLLARTAEKLDAEFRALIEHERNLQGA